MACAFWVGANVSYLHAPTGRRILATGEAAAGTAGQSGTRGKYLAIFRPGGAKEPLVPGTYSQFLLHVVFSTRGRMPWIEMEVAERLYPYIGGIVRAERGTLYAIGGVEDHVHMYLRWRPDGTVSDLMRTIKSRSSKWVHATYPELAAFGWQEGYSVFSVRKSQEEAVKAYIAKQAEHHRTEDHRSGLLRLLRLHDVEFEAKYVFD